MKPELRGLLGDAMRANNELGAGLTVEMVRQGVGYAYKTLDKIDQTLVEAESPRLATLIELANLSTILGNFIRMGIVAASNGAFTSAGPHKYQDLRANTPDAQNIEIKIALETNPPKGHLAKQGRYLFFRYVLCAEDGSYQRGVRGPVVWIWEIRFGHLEAGSFNVSNTEGDSGKTAVVSEDGMNSMAVVYFDLARCPYAPGGAFVRKMMGV